MSESKIEWTDYTFNPWSGCTKVSAGCANCYAAALPPGMRRGAHWGLWEKRVPASEPYWREPLRWARKAAAEGVRRRVFCASTADVFEERGDLDPLRERLWGLIAETPELDWLLLTKRPARMASWAAVHGWPANAWAGASVEDQAAADERVPHLLTVPAPVRFLSCEPLLGPVDLEPLWCEHCEVAGMNPTNTMVSPDGHPSCMECGREVRPTRWLRHVDWIIVGGESGPRARPMQTAWVRNLRDQAEARRVAFFFKQWGGVRKSETGRLLDGMEFLAFPTPVSR